MCKNDVVCIMKFYPVLGFLLYLYHFRDKRGFLSKFSKFSQPTRAFNAQAEGLAFGIL